MIDQNRFIIQLILTPLSEIEAPNHDRPPLRFTHGCLINCVTVLWEQMMCFCDGILVR